MGAVSVAQAEGPAMEGTPNAVLLDSVLVHPSAGSQIRAQMWTEGVEHVDLARGTSHHRQLLSKAQYRLDRVPLDRSRLQNRYPTIRIVGRGFLTWHSAHFLGHFSGKILQNWYIFVIQANV